MQNNKNLNDDLISQPSITKIDEQTLYNNEITVLFDEESGQISVKNDDV